MATSQHGQHGRRGTLGVAAAAAVLLVVGLVTLVIGLRGPAGPPDPAAAPAAVPAAVPVAAATSSSPTTTTKPRPTSTATRPPGGAAPTPSAVSSAPKSSAPKVGAPGSDLGQFLEASAPTKIEIPSIRVSSTTFVPLTVQSNGTISVPGTVHEVGLYRDGPTPGQLGPAVLAAHVDSPSGAPGIFYRLGAVKPGDQVRIARADGSRLSFTVDKVQAFKKTEFPTALVYRGDFTRSEIRLVTCGGPVDRENEYRDNVVVFAHLTGAKV